MRGVDAQVKKVSGSAPRAANNIRKIGTASKKASAGVNSLTKAFKGLIGAYAFFQTAKFAIVKTAELETQTRSLKVLTGDLDVAKGIIKELQDFGAVTPFTSTELIDTAKRLAAFGVETENLVDITKRLGDVAGATGADLGGIATAFGQIQAKGRLQGEELLQLQERGIGLQDELQKMYGLTGEEFRKALEKGQFSAEAVNIALVNLTETGGKYADGAISQSDTLAGKFSTLVDGITRVAQTLTTTLMPTLKGVLDLAIDTVNAVNAALAAGSLTDQQKQGFKSDAEKIVKSFAGPLPGGPFGAGEIVVRTGGKTYTGPASSVVSQITNDLINKEVQRLADAAAPNIPRSNVQLPAVGAPPPLLGSNGNGNGSGRSRSSGASAAAREAQRLVDEATRLREEEQKAIKNQDQILERLKLQVAIAGEKSELKKLELGYLLDILELEQEIKNKSEGASALRLQQLNQEYDLRRKIIDTQFDDNFYNAGFAMGAGLADEIGKANTELTDTEQLLQNSFNIVTDGLQNGIRGLIDGTKEWNDLLSDVLGNLGNMLLQFGFNSLGGALNIPGFADGGILPTNGPAIVGEEGPELVMNRGGQSRVFSNRDSQAALSRYSPANARSIEELAMSGDSRMKSEWGWGDAAAPINISTGPVLEFDGNRYVTQEEFARGVQSAAKQGEQRALRRLAASPGQRRKIGLR